MKNFKGVWSAVFALATGVVASGPVAAQPRAALVQSIDDAARVPYQEGAFRSCQIPGNCSFVFNAVPGGRRRTVEHVSCYVKIPSGTVEHLTLGSSLTRIERAFVPFVRPNGQDEFVANSSVLLFYNAGESPRLDIQQSGYQSMFFCTLTGREVSLQ